jgi:hypothetical protein
MKNLDYMQGQLDFMTEMVDWFNNRVVEIKDLPRDSYNALDELEDIIAMLSLSKYLTEKEVEEFRSSAKVIDEDNRPTFEEDGD